MKEEEEKERSWCENFQVWFLFIWNVNQILILSWKTKERTMIVLFSTSQSSDTLIYSMINAIENIFFSILLHRRFQPIFFKLNALLNYSNLSLFYSSKVLFSLIYFVTLFTTNKSFWILKLNFFLWNLKKNIFSHYSN